MFEFTRTPRNRGRRVSVDPAPARQFPYRLAVISAAVIAMALVLALDEGHQYDPAVERQRLESELKSIAESRQDVLTRKAKIKELVAKAASGTIPSERLPPVWQAPFTFNSMEEWQAAARRRLKRCAEELQTLSDRETRALEDLNELPPPDAKRTSFFRRTLNAILGNFEPKEVE